MEAFNENNRALVELGNRMAALQPMAEEMKDIRDHWTEWRGEWERKLERNEIQALRSVADLHGAFQKRVDTSLIEQRKAFHAELRTSADEIQRRLWADMERFRAEYERIIHAEL